jgi:transketolase
MNSNVPLHEKAINTIRFLSADAVQKANSGHPGMPMGAAAMAYTLWKRHLRFNPKNPEWPDRDRFVLSGGHGSMLLYSLLYLTGYDVSLGDIKNFRQWQSNTPGHPESFCTPGVEVTTGPLGQGFANAVGMAIAEKHLAAVFNEESYNIVNHHTYAIVTDGDLMEGISSEAASLAGHLKLGKLVMLYDDNNISIDGSTDLTFTEDVGKRFEAYGWHVQKIDDGNDIDAIDAAIEHARKDERPSLIMCRTHIGYGLPTRQNTAKAHGEPAGEEELSGAKEKLGWPQEKFYVPDEVLEHFREALEQGEELQSTWRRLFSNYEKEYPKKGAEFKRRLDGRLPADWNKELPIFDPDEKGIATRAASGKTLDAITPRIPEMIGGSADLTGSNKTWIKGSEDFQADSPAERNIYFGVREHAMGGIINGMSVHGGLLPYCGTFFVFSDYMRPAIRLSALSGYPSIWVFTHDSIGLGEDGPTHQPIEHLASLRAMPNLVVIRPGDANEVTEAWRVAIQRRDNPTAIVLTRQNVPILDRSIYNSQKGLLKGAYVLRDFGDGEPDIILMASGSEVPLIAAAGEILADEGHNVRVVSFPSWEIFEKQEAAYKESILPDKVKARLAVEAGVAQGWQKWVGNDGDIISIERFGASAPYEDLFENYGFTCESIVKRAHSLLK